MAAAGLNVVFQDLTYTVESSVEKGKQLTLLENVSGYLQPHQLTALLGPSGSGKSTLLDVLAGRKTVGSITGSVYYGGVEPTSAFLRRYTGYVEQFDTLVPSLTVREMLLYTAELKRSRSEPYASKAAAVDKLITQLGLDVCKDVRIGDPLSKGISGGQAKRTNIGIALISDPRVLFLDEPTSGLDSYSANEVVDLIKGLSQQGVTVVATIHSPTATAFAMFDRILMLARGRVCYFGDNIGDAAIDFARLHWPGATDQQFLDSSRAEFLVDLVTRADRQKQGHLLADAYEKSQLYMDNKSQLSIFMAPSSKSSKAATSAKRCYLPSMFNNSKTGDSLEAVPPMELVVRVTDSNSGTDSSAQSPVHQDSGWSGLGSPLAPDAQVTVMDAQAMNISDPELEAQLATRTATATPWWWALLVMLKYRSRVNYTDPAWIMPRLADKLLFAFVILTLYLRTGNDYEASNLVNLGSSLFMWTTLPAFGAVAYVPSIVLERKLFYRERADGLYTVATYFIAKLIEEIALATVISVIFSAVVFYGVQYQGSFLLFWLVYLFVLANGIVLGYVVAAVAPNMDVANATLPAYVTLALFFAGQLATFDSIPKYWEWYSRIDFVRYSWTALMVNQFEHNNPVFSGGDQPILSYYGMAGEDKWVNMSYLLAFFAVYATLGYLALAFIRHSKR